MSESIFSLFGLSDNNNMFMNSPKFLGTFTSEIFALDALRELIEFQLNCLADKWNQNSREKERQNICKKKLAELQNCKHDLESYNGFISSYDISLVAMKFLLDSRYFLIVEHKHNEMTDVVLRYKNE